MSALSSCDRKGITHKALNIYYLDLCWKFANSCSRSVVLGGWPLKYQVRAVRSHPEKCTYEPIHAVEFTYSWSFPMEAFRVILLGPGVGRTHFSTPEMLKYLLSLQNGSLVRKCFSEWDGSPFPGRHSAQGVQEGSFMWLEASQILDETASHWHRNSIPLVVTFSWFMVDPILVILRRLSGS